MTSVYPGLLLLLCVKSRLALILQLWRQGVQYALAETFVRMIRNVAAQKEIFDVLLVGGVVSNAYIRRHMIEKLAKRRIRVWIPESRFSPDNAAGCAAYAFRQGESSYE